MMADNSGDEGSDLRSGFLYNRNGHLMMHIIPKSSDPYWVMVTNFTIKLKHHSLNAVQNHGSYFIFECQVKDGSCFTVPLTLTDLCDNKAVLAVFEPLMRPHSGMIYKDWLGKASMGSHTAQLYKFLYSLINEYNRDVNNQSGALVTKSTGFIHFEHNHVQLTAYCLGPNSIIAQDKAFGPEIDAMPKFC